MWKSAALAVALVGFSLANAPEALAWHSTVVVGGGYWGGGYYPPPYYYGPPPAYYAPPVVVYQRPAPPPPPVIVYQQAAPAVDAVPTGPVYQDAATGRYCREYQSTVAVAGQPQRAFGTACQQPDGTWRIVQ